MRYLYPDTPLDGVLRFSPRVKGELRLAERRLLEFTPQAGALKPGREYTCRVRMAKLTGIDSLRDFAFSFFVAERKTQLQVTGIRVDPADTRYMQAEGTLSFSAVRSIPKAASASSPFMDPLDPEAMHGAMPES